jgi:hypothetical protein
LSMCFCLKIRLTQNGSITINFTVKTSTSSLVKTVKLFGPKENSQYVNNRQAGNIARKENNSPGCEFVLLLF